ncbi:putative MFS transporter [Prauserella sediminis]|uniref:Putative MFS transporter n=1 Tax=Prauserella sediminis TaxID=577680 RepID=A0A839XX98_9PSEU|nr:MFS transporter [Prauserella sediminis]MBB3664646.1 putative MFS transporter [Prauserella sediminis]
MNTHDSPAASGDGVGTAGTPATGPSVGDVCDTMVVSRRHVVAAAVLFITFVIEAWEQVGLVYVSGGIAADFGISNTELGWALSAVAFGMVPGALLWGVFIDRLGRRRVTVYSLLLYAALALLAGISPEFWMFLILRLLSGVAFGGVYATTFPYFMELLPTAWRGRGAVALSIGFPVGTLLCILVSQALGPISWRVVAIVAALAGLWAFAVIRWVPESPYWLAKQNRHREAARVLRGFGAAVPEDTLFRVDEQGAGGVVRGLFAPAIRRRFALLVLVAFTFSWGYWGLQTWLPVLLEDRGMSVSGALWFVAVSQLVSVPGYLLAAWLTGRYGRKKVFVGFVCGAVVGGVLFGLATGPGQMYTGNLILAFFSLGAWGIWNTWSGEILPTSLRGRGYSFTTSAILLAHSVSVPVIGAMMDNGVTAGVTIASIMAFLIVALLAVFPLPETEGRALD